MYLWNISTTIRNPDRIRGFLYVAKQFEGLKWNTENQINYFIELIRHGYYKPKIIQNTNIIYPITFEEALKYAQLYEYKIGLDGRGRTAFSPLVKLNFVTIDIYTNIHITDLGNYFISDINMTFDIPLLQYKNSYDYYPIRATLKLINEINKLYIYSQGISYYEFSHFAMMINTEIEFKQCLDNLIHFRNNEFSLLDIKNMCFNYECIDDYLDNNLRYINKMKCFILEGNKININLNYIHNLESDLNIQIL